MPEMPFSEKIDCDQNIATITELLNSGIFDPSEMRNVFRRPAFTELMICLRDLMCKTEKYASRIDFTEDVIQNEYVKDLTGAITAVRDACCHIDSFKRNFDDNGNRGAFNVVFGKGTLAKINGVELKSDYADDIAIFYGANRLYLKRHIVRASEEAKKRLAPIIALHSSQATELPQGTMVSGSDPAFMRFLTTSGWKYAPILSIDDSTDPPTFELGAEVDSVPNDAAIYDLDP